MRFVTLSLAMCLSHPFCHASMEGLTWLQTCRIASFSQVTLDE